ncbi:DUF1566 domain-containing protein [bacterium]|nr:DUF1566 domain-containing protein [bacterium]
MTLFKCKMCGGDLSVEEGKSVCVCGYCGTKQTVPKLDDEKRASLYDRANHFRRNNDFDKAMGIYETILNEDKTDAEAYWSLVLCKYGIEYVEDPETRRLIPTINRTQFTSVLADEDYKSALEYATIEQKIIYESEAGAIDRIQKGILEISNKEEPFDVFICYKETDSGGRRTPDSVLATELYHELTDDGFKVFFSRITLEDKLGQEYEPYIFAALNSAKVMVVIGTKPEYFKAAWVKNEWSRFLALIKNGAKKTLIPAYKNMDPYNLPEEFSHLQALDMSKLGFMQDLVHGIKKLVLPDKTLKISASELLKLHEEEKERLKEKIRIELKREEEEKREAEERKRIAAERAEAAQERLQEKSEKNKIFRLDEYEANKKKQDHELRDGCLGCFAVILIIFLLCWGCTEIFSPSEKEKAAQEAAKEAERMESARKYAEEQKKAEERRKAEEERKKEEELLRLEKLEQEEEARIAAAKKSTGLLWSKKSEKWMNWKEAAEYCKNLEEKGFKNWRLPNIDELRKLIQNCPRTKTGGKCRVSKKGGCLSLKCYNSEGCVCENKEYSSDYSILEDNDELWSSSVRADDSYEVWYINFQDGGIHRQNIDKISSVRCVR